MCFESGSHWQDEASTSRGAQLFGAPAAKTARGDDDRSGVPDDASSSTLGTESRRVLEILVPPVYIVVAARSSVASADPAHFNITLLSSLL